MYPCAAGGRGDRRPSLENSLIASSNRSREAEAANSTDNSFIERAVVWNTLERNGLYRIPVSVQRATAMLAFKKWFFNKPRDSTDLSSERQL
jgi:hypothetical protein